MLGHKSTQILFDVYEKFIPRRTRQDGSALVFHMKQEAGVSGVQTNAETGQIPGITNGLGSGG
jgi:hypothetical protein